MAEFDLTTIFFSFAADRMHAREKTFAVPEGTTVRDLFDRYLAASLQAPFETWLFAVNEEWADAEAVLAPGDRVAVIPPVSGG